MSDEISRNIDWDTVKEFAKDAPDRWSKLTKRIENAEAEATRLSKAETSLRGLLRRSHELITQYIIQMAEEGWDLPDEVHELVDELAEELRDG